MENLVLKKYKKGDKIAGIYLTSFAGKDMYVASAYGIYADVFDKGTYYQVPNVVSMNKGSGRFLDFLITLKRGLDKPVYFTSITNQGIYKYLCFADVGVVQYKNSRPSFYKVEETVWFALKPVRKKYEKKS